MATRDELFRRFGPKLLEAMFLVLLEEINTLRPGQGHPTISMQDLIDNAANHLNSLHDYSWQSLDAGE